MKSKSSKKRVLEKPRDPLLDGPMVVETFMHPGYELRRLGEGNFAAPWVMNGEAHVHRYRVTAELIQEPDEVVMARVQDLWERCDNHHHWALLHAVAAKYGVTLDHATNGIRREKRS